MEAPVLKHVRWFITISFVLLLTGCGSKAPPPAADAPPDTPAALALSATVAKVALYDERQGVHDPERSLHMPQTGFVGKRYDLAPALSDGDRTLIESETRGHFAPGDRRVEVDIYIMRGEQSFTVGEMKEQLWLAFTVRIEVANQKDVRDVVTAEGESVITRESVHIDRDSVPGLYAQVIRESISDAFSKIVGR